MVSEEKQISLSLKPGTRLYSAVCATEMIVVKARADAVDLTIGGALPLTDAAARDGTGSVAEGFGGGTRLGKRYVDAGDTLELLCTKPGDGAPAVDGQLLSIKDAKPLPASD